MSDSLRESYVPSIPLNLEDEEYGYLVIDKLEGLVRQNLTNLLLTDPGERIIEMEFGVGLRRFLFQNRTPNLENSIRSSISSQVSRYMPYLSIQEIRFTSEPGNPNLLGIRIFYSFTGEEGQQITDILDANFGPNRNRL